MRAPGLSPRRTCAALLRRVGAALLSAALLGPAAAAAAPYTPHDDATVLEHVPERSALERLAPLRQAVAREPADLASALTLATAYIELGRRDADPRFIAYAQATLGPWLARADPPEPALVLAATALQYLHRFDEALVLLERALALAPLDAQAWLTRASLLELRGDYTAARRACARLLRSADEFSALTCLTSVDGRSGALAQSYAALAAAGVDARLPAPLRAWRLAVLADLAERLGDDAAAQRQLAAALAANGTDPYLKAAYADLLLRTARPTEVLRLLQGSEAQDPLLLRLAIAAHRGGSAAATRWADAYGERLAAARRAGDSTHLREAALYWLDVRGDAGAALDAARRNWRSQREPADVRVYARAALAAHAQADLAQLREWLALTRYQDHVLPGLSAEVRP